jgi:Fe-S-cluster containining protein
MAMITSQPTDAVSRLCPQCGLCCNGVLFADVELQKGDDARRLATAGLSLVKKGHKTALVQPCACFDGKLCRIYPERPVRCRTFECGLLKRTQAGTVEVKAALKTIAEARRRVDKVRRRLRESGQKDEQLALIKRYSQVMSGPIDLSGGEDGPELRGRLMLAVEDLMQLLQRDFLK